jgi:hypothetical protein
MRLPGWAEWLLVVCLIGLATGCALSRSALAPTAPVQVDEGGPLAGEALASRRVDLERAYDDMVHFQAALRGLLDRKDRDGSRLLGDFLSRYVGEYLDPLLESRWQSSHPELMSVDASLRLIKTEILIDMSRPKEVEQTLGDLAQRFEGRAQLLVEHPVGEQCTLLEALEDLDAREWTQSSAGKCEESSSLKACLRASF